MSFPLQVVEQFMDTGRAPFSELVTTGAVQSGVWNDAIGRWVCDVRSWPDEESAIKFSFNRGWVAQCFVGARYVIRKGEVELWSAL